MKGSIAQYITLGIMLLAIVLIVSFYPVQHHDGVSSKLDHVNNVAKLTSRDKTGKVRAD